MKKNLHNYFGFKLLNFLILSFLSISMSQANVNQRIIIYFNQPLSEQAAAEVHKQLKGYMPDGYSLAEHSSGERWILVLNSSLNQVQFNKFKKAFLKNNNVKHIELDQMLQQSVVPRAVPFSTVDIF